MHYWIKIFSCQARGALNLSKIVFINIFPCYLTAYLKLFRGPCCQLYYPSSRYNNIIVVK